MQVSSLKPDIESLETQEDAQQFLGSKGYNKEFFIVLLISFGVSNEQPIQL